MAGNVMQGRVAKILLVICLACGVLPQAFLLYAAAYAGDPVWRSGSSMMLGMISNTLVVSGVAVAVASALGLAAAWLVVRGDVCWRRTLSVALCLPFAVPSYVYATALLGVDGPHWWMPRGPMGVGLLLGLTLYPWVYIPVKATLARQSKIYRELAVSLGLGPWRRWWSVELPMLLPTIAATALLVLMGVLNDFGTAALLGVKTLSVGVHDALFSLQRRDWAAQLSLIGLAIPLLAVVLLALAEHRRAVHQPSNQGGAIPPAKTPAALRWAGTAVLAVIVGVCFLLPVTLLLERAWPGFARMRLDDVPALVLRSTVIAGVVVALCLSLALGILLLVRRGYAHPAWRRLGWLFNLNYAIPSSMIAIALLFGVAQLPGPMVGWLLSDTAATLVFGCVLSYICFPFATIAAGLATVPRSVDEVCVVSGVRGLRRLTSVELPLLARHLACGALLVLVLVAQELPLTLVLQPFDFTTLGLRMYDLARVEAIRPAAVYAVILIALLIYPVIALDRLIMGDRHAPG
jgi:iron(III) transport system permease protein